MLVLSRRIGEEIIINDNIRLTVVAIRGSQVRLGFTAPREVSIQRSELLEMAVAANKEPCLVHAASMDD